MNYKTIKRYLEFSERLRPIDLTNYFHITYVFRGNKLLTIGTNNYSKQHPHHKYGEYKQTKHSIQCTYTPGLHSEIAALNKLNFINCSNLVFLNFAFTKAGNLTTSKPCKNCYSVLLKQTGFKKIIYYDKQDNQFKTIKP